ncbi:hypothetical protein [Azospirillum largimobile]
MIWTETSSGLFPGETARVGRWTLTLWRSWRGCGWSAAAAGHRFIDGVEGTRDAARAAAAAAVLARAADSDLSAHERAALTVIAQQRD